MSAANTDKVRNATWTFATTLANSMLEADTTMTLASTTNLPTATAIDLVIDATDPATGNPTPTLKEVVKGVVSGSTVTNLVRGLDGTTQQAHSSGANVVMVLTAAMWNDFQTAFLANHTQAGAPITNFPVTSPDITTGINDANGVQIIGLGATASAVNQVKITDAITTAAPTIAATGTDSNVGLNVNIKGSGILASNSATATLNSNPVWQILGTASITSGLNTSSTSAVYATGLGKAVTIPAGCNFVKITVFAEYISSQTASSGVTIGIWSGATVGTLTTQLATMIGYPSVANAQVPCICMALLTAPSAGAISYSTSYNTGNSSDNAVLAASSTAPAFILVEAC